VPADEEELALIAAAIQALDDRRKIEATRVSNSFGESASRWRFRTRAPRDGA
jgi:hypothetical protein